MTNLNDSLITNLKDLTIMANQQLNSVLTLAGVKGEHSLIAAVQSINAAALHNITDGNTRPFDETKAALTKGVTKSGELANNQQGLVLGALLTAAKSARTYFEQLHDNGDGKLNKKLTADDKILAANYANGISDAFLAHYNGGLSQMKEKRAEAAAKTKETKQAAAKSAELTEAIKAEESRLQAEKAAADTLTISEFLTAIKSGDADALAMAENIAAALSAFKLGKANKAAATKTKNEKANVSPIAVNA
jgi:hypothetical protein